MGTVALLILALMACTHAVVEESRDFGKSVGSQQRFFHSVKPVESNQLEEKVDDPNTALEGVYSDCLVNLSFPCLQRKILVFLDRLGRMARFNLIGNFLSVVRTAKDSAPLVTEEALIARKIDDQSSLKHMIDDAIDKFFDQHVIRVTLPDALGDSGRSSSVLDFRVGEDYLEEGRGKKKGGKMKGMKKMMMMGCMMMMGKFAMLGPMIMGISSLAAIKALIFSTAALTIVKIIVLKKLKMMKDSGGGGGGGGGWPSSGGGGGGGGGGGWSSGGGGGSGWSADSGGGGGGWGDRSYDAHPIVYRAYR